MSGQDETLRLVAEVVNKWSGPLRQMQQDMRSVAGATKAMHADGIERARKHAEAYGGIRKAIDEVKSAIAEGAKPAMEGLGLSVLSVAGAIAAVTTAVRDFASATPKLIYLSRETHMAVDSLRTMQALGERLGVSAEGMSAGLGQFAEHMAKLRRGAPAELNAWLQMGPAVYQFGQSLRGLNQGQALDRTLKFLDRIRDEDQKRRFLNFLGLPRELANLRNGELEGAIAEIRKNIGSLGPEAQKRGLEAKNAFDTIRESVEHLKEELAIELAPVISDAAKRITEFLRATETQEGIKSLVENLKSLKTVAEAIGTALGAVRSAIEWLDRHTPHGLLGERNSLRYGTRTHRNDFNLMEFLRRHAPEHGPGSGNYASDIWQRLFGGSTAAPGQSPEDQKDTIKKGTEEGTKSGLQQFFEGLGNVAPMSYQPGEGAARAYGGGKFKMFGPGGAGSAVKSSLTQGGDADVPTGTGGGPSGVKGSMRATAGVIADAWRQAGMSENGIAGILANVRDESGFNPTLRHPDQPRWGGEAHFAHGLYQEGGAEWNRYAAWLGKNYPGADWRDPKLQSEFAAYNLKTNYPGVWRRMTAAGTGGQAAAAYVTGYLKPALAYQMQRSAKYLRGVRPVESYTGPRDRDHGGSLGRPALERQSLLEHARDSGVLNGGTTVKGDAQLRIDLNGFPRATRTRLAASGMFKDVTLNRGRPMTLASQDA